MVLVAVENTDDESGRVHDLTPPGLSVSGSSTQEGGDRFLDFLESELLPAVDRQFREASRALWWAPPPAGCSRPTPPPRARPTAACWRWNTPIHLGSNWLAQKLLGREKEPAAPPLRYVSYEARFGWPEDLWSALVAGAPVPGACTGRSAAGDARDDADAGRLPRSPRGLRDYSRMAAPFSPTTATLPYYEKLAGTFGATLIRPGAWWRTWWRTC
jgi:hypothetical protein